MTTLIKLLICLAFGINTVCANEKTYTVAFPDSEFYPQYQLDNKRGAIGVLPTIIKKFSSDTKIQLEIKFLPVKRYMEYFRKGHVDFILPSNPLWSPQLKKGLAMKYSKPIMTSAVGVLVEKINKDIKKKELKTLGTISGYTVNGFDEEIKSGNLKVSYNNDPYALLKQVSLKRIQGAYFHLDIAHYTNRKHNTELVLASNLPIIKYDYHLSTHKFPKIVAAFDQWMSKNKMWIKAQMLDYSIQMKNGMLLLRQNHLATN